MASTVSGRKCLVGSDRAGEIPAVDQQVAGQETNQVLLRNPPELGDVPRELRGIRKQDVKSGPDPVPVVAGCNVRADQATALGLPSQRVVHKLAYAPLVAGCRLLPLAVGDLTVYLAPLGGGLSPEIQRWSSSWPPPARRMPPSYRADVEHRSPSGAVIGISAPYGRSLRGRPTLPGTSSWVVRRVAISPCR